MPYTGNNAPLKERRPAYSLSGTRICSLPVLFNTACLALHGMRGYV